MRKSGYAPMLALILTALGFTTACISNLLPSAPQRKTREPHIWPSQPPADCPFPKSNVITTIVFTGRSAHYGSADTWYPSWAEDNNLY